MRSTAGAPGLLLFINAFITHTHTHCSYRIQQRCPHILSVAIPQARPTELSPHTATALVPTHCLGIDGLLPALMAGVTLRESNRGGCGIHGDTHSDTVTHAQNLAGLLLGTNNSDLHFQCFSSRVDEAKQGALKEWNHQEEPGDLSSREPQVA